MSDHVENHPQGQPSPAWGTSQDRKPTSPSLQGEGHAAHPPRAAAPGEHGANAVAVRPELFGNLFGFLADPPWASVAANGGPAVKPAQHSTNKNQAKPIDDALKHTKELLDPAAKHLDPAKDAVQAVQVLNSLNPAQQKQALQKMGKEDFQRLLTSVPKDDRVAFESLYKCCPDPERKLLLWAEFHKSKVAGDAKAQKETVPLLEGIGDFFGHPSDTKRRNADRDEVAATTEAEVEEEKKYLLDRMHSGKKFSGADVDKLADRKSLESKIELKHLVNITNDVTNVGTPNASTSMPTERVTWSKHELEQVASGLDRLPADATTNNPLLKEIRRSKVRQDFDAGSNRWVKDQGVGGDHADGVIRIFDTGVNSPYRHTGQTSDLGDHHKGQKTPHGRISPLEETVVHEVGHDVDDLSKVASDKFRAVTGWKDDARNRNDLKAKLQASGLSPADADARINQLETERANNYGGEGITVNGTTYKVDQYDPNGTGYTSHKEGAVPKGDPSNKVDEWDYARTNYKEHFAELYAKAVHVPERLHRDLIGQPEREVQSKQAERTRLQERLDKLRAGNAKGAQIAAVESQVKQADLALTKAKEQQTMLNEEWRIMREDVFHVNDKKVDDSAAQLIQAVPPEKQKAAVKLQAEFKKKADSAVTPQQLEELQADYQKKVHAL